MEGDREGPPVSKWELILQVIAAVAATAVLLYGVALALSPVERDYVLSLEYDRGTKPAGEMTVARFEVQSQVPPNLFNLSIAANDGTDIMAINPIAPLFAISAHDQNASRPQPWTFNATSVLMFAEDGVRSVEASNSNYSLSIEDPDFPIDVSWYNQENFIFPVFDFTSEVPARYRFEALGSAMSSMVVTAEDPFVAFSQDPNGTQFSGLTVLRIVAPFSLVWIINSEALRSVRLVGGTAEFVEATFEMTNLHGEIKAAEVVRRNFDGQSIRGSAGRLDLHPSFRQPEAILLEISMVSAVVRGDDGSPLDTEASWLEVLGSVSVASPLWAAIGYGVWRRRRSKRPRQSSRP